MPFYYEPFVFLSCLAITCFISSSASISNNGGITIDLIHRDSPLSPFYNPTESRFERLRNSFKRTFSRVSTLKSAFNTCNKMVAPVTANGGEYLMEIGVGTPPVQTLAIADTGSDLTWMQCAPCMQCYNQTAPLFYPTNSSTYQNVSCMAPQCKALGIEGGPNCDNANNCLYQMDYGDNSYSNGNLATETFTFASGDPVEFPGVVLGCGHNEGGMFDAKGSGIVGLGGGPLSIIRQLDKSVGGKFSYCLTSLSSNASSKISFGSDATVAGPNVSSTPLLKKTTDTFYYLALEGVSVDNDKLEYKYDPNIGGEKGNIIIDSGTTLTLLPKDLYNGLEAALVKAVKGKRVPDSQEMFHLCYEVPGNGDQLVYPTITVHFAGADLFVTEESVFVEVEKGVVCLTFLPADNLGVAIFGNLHQMNHVIGYDLVNQKLNFLATDCSMPR